MFNLNIASAIKKMPVNKLRDFIFENFYKRIGFVKKKNLLLNETFEKKGFLFLANKLIEKSPDPCNAKEQYQSFLRKENEKSVKQ